MGTSEYESFTAELSRRINRAADIATGRTALEASRAVRASMPGPGASASDSLDRGTGQNDRFTPSMPGSPPGVRSGNLQRSISFEQLRQSVWTVSTNWAYALIHEFGGTIKHPGGTPYVVTDAGAVFITKQRAGELESEGKFVGYTKPHTITMPARPFFKPTIEAMHEQLFETYRQAFKEAMTS